MFNQEITDSLKQELEKNNITTEYCDIEYIAKNTVDLDESAKNRLNKLTDALDELEDVNDFYTNDS